MTWLQVLLIIVLIVSWIISYIDRQQHRKLIEMYKRAEDAFNKTSESYDKAFARFEKLAKK